MQMTAHACKQLLFLLLYVSDHIMSITNLLKIHASNAEEGGSLMTTDVCLEYGKNVIPD